MRALIVDDHVPMARALSVGLEQIGFSTVACHQAEEAVTLAVSGHFDVILLDWVMPQQSGVDVCRVLRRRKVNTPILMITSLDDVEHTVTALDAGADDYLPKPFSFQELVARMRALLRRGAGTEGAVLRCDTLEMRLHARCVTRDGVACQLSNREFALLEFFMRNQDRVLTREQIAESVWPDGEFPASDVLKVHVSALRRKLALGGDTPHIHTVKHVGYRFGRASRGM